MKIMIAVVCLTLSIGCSTTPVARAPIETSRTFDAPFEKVWGATVSALSEVYPVKNIDKTSGLIATEFVSGSVRGYGYPPSVLLGVWSDGRHRVTAFVRAIDAEHTSVKVTAHLECFEFNVSHSWYVWDSNGTVEQLMFQKITSSL